MAAFGWSASDLVVAAQFVVKVAVALREVGGAASDYQESVDFLCAVELTLQNICKVRSLPRCDVHAAIVHEQAQSIGSALKIFIDDIEGFDKSLGAKRKRGFNHGALRKVQWATLVSKRVTKLREKISLPIATINTNLGLITLYVRWPISNVHTLSPLADLLGKELHLYTTVRTTRQCKGENYGCNTRGLCATDPGTDRFSQ
jgi:hypothetical protein